MVNILSPHQRGNILCWLSSLWRHHDVQELAIHVYQNDDFQIFLEKYIILFTYSKLYCVSLNKSITPLIIQFVIFEMSHPKAIFCRQISVKITTLRTAFALDTNLYQDEWKMILKSPDLCGKIDAVKSLFTSRSLFLIQWLQGISRVMNSLKWFLVFWFILQSKCLTECFSLFFYDFVMYSPLLVNVKGLATAAKDERSYNECSIMGKNGDWRQNGKRMGSSKVWLRLEINHETLSFLM